MNKHYNPIINWVGHRHDLQDGKYTQGSNYVPGMPYGQENPPFFPGYIENAEHPFMFCHSLTHSDPNDPTKLSFKYSGTDGPKEYERNRLTQGPNWKYHNKEVTYNFNSSGYRTYEWSEINWKEAILLFGCSSTYGVGVAEDETLSYYLEKLTGRQVVNFGFPGGSNSLIATLCSIALEKYGDPYAVVINWSTGDRYRHYFKDRYVEIGPWHHSSVTKTVENRMVQGTDLSAAWEHRYIDRYNELAENFYIAKMVKTMCRNIRYVTMSYYFYMAHINRADFCVNLDNGARDLLHPSSDNHQEAANKIYKLLKQKDSQ